MSIFFKEYNTFIHQGWIDLKDCKDKYNVTQNVLYINAILLTFFVHQRKLRIFINNKTKQKIKIKN